VDHLERNFPEKNELTFNANYLESVGQIEKTQALIHAIKFFD